MCGHVTSPPPIDSDEEITLREALIRMVNDPDHSVRMHLAKVVTSLHSGVAGATVELLPRQDQLETFQQIYNMLRKAYMISVSQ